MKTSGEAALRDPHGLHLASATLLFTNGQTAKTMMTYEHIYVSTFPCVTFAGRHHKYLEISMF